MNADDVADLTLCDRDLVWAKGVDHAGSFLAHLGSADFAIGSG